ncbi:MAG: ATP-dependent DNA helicase RecG [Thiohalocapsa sp.]
MAALPSPAAELTVLKGVGPRVAERLERIGLHRVQDLLFHLPLRYQDRTRVVPIGSLRQGQEAVIQGEIDHTEVVLRRRRVLLVHLSDGTGGLTLRFFHFSNAQRENLRRGIVLRCFGEARAGAKGLELIHPEYEAVPGDAEPPTVDSLTAIYPTTEGLHQLSLRRLSDQAIATAEALPELIPEDLLEPGQPTLAEALKTIHRPSPDVDLAQLRDGRHPAQRRLAFEELVAHNLSLTRLRARMTREPAPALAGDGRLTDGLRARLPFELTGAQQRVVAEILADLRQAHPMMRLVQGDVGSGKTIVAAVACLAAVEQGLQAAIMAPTELLAEQHLRVFRGWLQPLGVEVGWLSGKLRNAERSRVLEAIADGRVAVVVGTHALFQEGVRFDDLAVVVVDEQHRFGVHQRLALREKGLRDGRYPHQLIMTATPIPRTLAMTAYADLDYSVIDELPPGRTPIKTVAVPASRRDEVVQRVARACEQGRQAYWVCTLVEESEKLQAEAAEATEAALREALPQLRVGLVHGRMKAPDKEAIMRRFSTGELDLLVATTVIEVGVDVPNASLMIIENAERLGLAQLHQLRGRVGRGSTESSCVLLYQPPLTDTATRRIDALRRTTDGFEIARVDLELRGPGEVLGTRQTGMMQFRIADVLRDQDLLPRVQAVARAILEEHPENVEPLIERWLGEAADLGRVG